MPAPHLPTRPCVLVVFEDQPESRWLRWLRPGFRHCFCLVRGEGGWIVCDSRSDGLVILPAPDCGVEPLARSYARLGARVLAVAGRPARGRLLPPGPFTCVELVKRVLGLNGCGILTPYRLYRRLKAQPSCWLEAGPA